MGIYSPFNRYRDTCPVCKVFFGMADENEVRSYHCDECCAIFTFYPKALKPTAQLDNKIPKRCGCKLCNR